MVIITTKYHAVYAAVEGVDYSWGFLKSVYRRRPLVERKGKDNFNATNASVENYSLLIW